MQSRRGKKRGRSGEENTTRKRERGKGEKGWEGGEWEDGVREGRIGERREPGTEEGGEREGKRKERKRGVAEREKEGGRRVREDGHLVGHKISHMTCY